MKQSGSLDQYVCRVDRRSDSDACGGKPVDQHVIDCDLPGAQHVDPVHAIAKALNRDIAENDFVIRPGV